jgi:hypothetical protein
MPNSLSKTPPPPDRGVALARALALPIPPTPTPTTPTTPTALLCTSAPTTHYPVLHGPRLMVRQARRPTDQGYRGAVACTRTRLAFSRSSLASPCLQAHGSPARLGHVTTSSTHLAASGYSLSEHPLPSRQRGSWGDKKQEGPFFIASISLTPNGTASAYFFQLTPFVFLLLRKAFPLCHHTNLLDHKQWFAPQPALLFQSSCSSAVPSYFHPFTATPSRPNFASFSAPQPQPTLPPPPPPPPPPESQNDHLPYAQLLPAVSVDGRHSHAKFLRGGRGQHSGRQYPRPQCNRLRIGDVPSHGRQPAGFVCCLVSIVLTED